MRETVLRRVDAAERQSKGESSGLKILFKLRDIPEEPFMAEARARYPGRELLVIEVLECDLASDEIASRVLVDALIEHTQSKPKDHTLKPPSPTEAGREYTDLDRARALAFIAAKARREAIH